MDHVADPARLFIVMGLPGSGKTTVATALAEAHRAERFSVDEVAATVGADVGDPALRARIEAAQRDRIEPLLQRGRSVVVESGPWTRTERDTLAAIGRAAGARVELHLLDAPVTELHRRLAGRGTETHTITVDDLRRWDTEMERPDATEMAGYDNARPLRAATLVDHFDGDVADAYDDVHEPDASTATAVEVLADLARATPVWGRARTLEFAVGTGRLAVPLAEQGIDVTGVDTSAAMFARLAAKPGATTVDARRGEMATAFLGEQFGLVYLMFNTIMNLTTQVEQRTCFANAAAHLAPGGRFVVEVVVPDGPGPTGRTTPGRPDARVFHLEDGYVGIDEITDPVTQQMTSHHYWYDGRTQYESTPFRYVWPSELDLMARLAGLELEHRWGDWDASPFTAASPMHVSVWRRRA